MVGGVIARGRRDWSRLEDSNPRPRPYEGRALPTELSRLKSVVPTEGVEPPRLATPDPKSGASTNSATQAHDLAPQGGFEPPPRRLTAGRPAIGPPGSARLQAACMWCPSRDSNPHAFRHMGLSHARLPFRHTGRTGLSDGIRTRGPRHHKPMLLATKLRSNCGAPTRPRSSTSGVTARGAAHLHHRHTFYGGPSGTRTLDTLVKSQMLCR